MPKLRANGEGNIRKRKDGHWEGRYTAGYDANGKAITKNVLGRTQAEVKDKLRTALNVLAAGLVTPVLPYLRSFAAGVMIYVLVEELVPEMAEGEHSNAATILFAAGFTLMVALDVALE